MLWVRLESEPVRQFYIDRSAYQFLDPRLHSAKILLAPGTLVSDAGGENANLTIALSNKLFAASTLLARRPPINKMLSLYEGDELLYTGVVRSITMTDTECTLETEA